MFFTRDHTQVRQATIAILEMVDDGILDARTALSAALGWMSDDEVEEMATANQFLEYPDEDEEV